MKMLRAFAVLAFAVWMAACAQLNLDNGKLPCSCDHTCPKEYVCGWDDHCWEAGKPATCEMNAGVACNYPNFCVPQKCSEPTQCYAPAALPKLPVCEGYVYVHDVCDGGQ